MYNEIFNFIAKRKKLNIAIFVLIIIIVGLFYLITYYTNSSFVPKPKGYIRIDLPDHKYHQLNGLPITGIDLKTQQKDKKHILLNKSIDFDKNEIRTDSLNKKNLIKNFPYNFEVSQYAIIKKTPYGKFSIDIYYPRFKANIHITYRPVKNNRKLLKKYWDAAYKLTNLHQSKASEMNEDVIENKNGIKVIVIEIDGEEIASQFNFHTSDGKKHFFRGALYFDAEPNQAFLAPMIKYIKKDIYHLIKTLAWNY